MEPLSFFEEEDVRHVRSSIRSTVRPYENPDDVLAGGAYLGQKRAGLHGREPRRSDLEFALAIFTWWPIKPEPKREVEVTLQAIRRTAFEGASTGRFAMLNALVPRRTLLFSMEELYAAQQRNVGAFLTAPLLA